MKTNESPDSWSLRNAVNDDGMRVITLWRTNHARFRPAKTYPLDQQDDNLKVRVQFAPEQVSSFDPLIRSHHGLTGGCGLGSLRSSSDNRG
jgi:hypothetical protein